MPSPNEITIPQLARLIGTPNCPTIVDVRLDDDVAASPSLIPTAIRHPHTDITCLVPQLQGKNTVVYCQKGKKISQGTMAILRQNGVQAESLKGGHLAWKEADQMLILDSKIPKGDSTGGSLWVTRHRPKIDRMACPWLIRRFVDREAKFLFVAPSEVLDVADKFNAIAFDLENVFWSHRGEKCTFDTMLDEFGLKSDALMRLATIVRGADTNNLALAPESAGLLAASLGLSRMYRDDWEQLNAGMALYDAFFRWARDASDETHDWPQHRPRT